MLSENRINLVTISISSFYRDFLGGPVVKNLPSGSALDPMGGRSRERGSETGAVLKKKKKESAFQFRGCGFIYCN